MKLVVVSGLEVQEPDDEQLSTMVIDHVLVPSADELAICGRCPGTAEGSTLHWR